MAPAPLWSPTRWTASAGSLRAMSDTDAVHEAAAEGFARGAGAYERGRPGYSPQAVSWLAAQLGLAAGARVLDLAAGTGKLTRLLTSTDASVVAVEPVDEMRAALAGVAPGVEVRAGTAEAIPLPAASVDAVVVAQAFHWFAGGPALAEIARVLTPTGRLGLVWNRRDLRLPLQAAISEIIEPYRGSIPSFMTGEWRETLEQTRLFVASAEHQIPYEQSLTVEQLIDRVLSVSFVAALSPTMREDVAGRVRALAQHHQAVPLCLGYVTELYAYAKRAA
jgi:ubiquinone/menaquinone biosynthesis C-methylase UbiE